MTMESGEKSVEHLGKEWKLSPILLNTLKSMEITSFFTVQAIAIPKLLDSSHYRIQDICISAPTGSGKTLSYVIPIIQRLLSRKICRLRALIVVPSRDLAIQVHRIILKCCENTSLQCGIAIGQSNFIAEQKNLIYKTMNCNGKFLFSSCVDILIATPGRLVDHLEQTEGFTLEHLQFLIVDEADRLLNQSYNEWISKMYSSLFPLQDKMNRMKDSSSAITPSTCRQSYLMDTKRLRTPLTRVLLSATLTKNPRKLASIGMNHAEVAQIEGDEAELSIASAINGDSAITSTTAQYTTPENLKEYILECEQSAKPLILATILEDLRESLTIVFTASVDATHRLTRLLQIMAGDEFAAQIREYSSNLSQKQRTSLIKSCAEGYVRVIICSDAMARGMDFENAQTVINYDVPSFIKTYIHRVGRTARAGRQGTCITLVKEGQLKAFYRMLKKKQDNDDGIKPFTLQKRIMENLLPKYKTALGELKELLNAEQSGDLKTTHIGSKRRLDTSNPAREHLMQELHACDPKDVLELLRSQLIHTVDKKSRNS